MTIEPVIFPEPLPNHDERWRTMADLYHADEPRCVDSLIDHIQPDHAAFMALQEDE